MDRNKNQQVNFWMDKETYKLVRQKANRESVNLSSLIRTFLEEWLKGTPREKESQ